MDSPSLVGDCAPPSPGSSADSTNTGGGSGDEDTPRPPPPRHRQRAQGHGLPRVSELVFDHGRGGGHRARDEPRGAGLPRAAGSAEKEDAGCNRQGGVDALQEGLQPEPEPNVSDDTASTTAEHSSSTSFSDVGSGVEEFKVVISKTKGQKLGLTMNSVDGATLYISKLTSDGLVQQWNGNHPGRTVTPGHCIVEVNGIRNKAKLMRDECGQDKTLEIVFMRFQEQRKVTPAVEAELKKKAFRAVVQDDLEFLMDVMMIRLHWNVWSRWRNAGGIDLLDLSWERGSRGARYVLAKVWLWQEVAWASVRDWACLHALVAKRVAKGHPFPRPCASSDEEFKVVISKTNGQNLGLLHHSVHGATLRITKVMSDGLVQQWNENHPGRTVKPGHRIVEINGIRNNAKLMVDECKQDKTLELVVKREEVALGRLSALIVRLPADLLALVLQYAREGARDTTREWAFRRDELLRA